MSVFVVFRGALAHDLEVRAEGDFDLRPVVEAHLDLLGRTGIVIPFHFGDAALAYLRQRGT